MIKRKSFFIAAMIGGSLMVGGFASANTIDFTYNGATGPVGGLYTYSYDVALSGDGTLNPSAAYSQGATLYDIFGYSAGSASFSASSALTADHGSFAVSEANSGGFITGVVVAAGGNDSSSVPNVTITYAPLGGATLVAALSDLGTLTYESTNAPATGLPTLYVGSVNAKNPPDGTASKDVEQTTGPGISTPPVPLPPEVWAGGVLFGLLGVGEFLKARRRANVEA